MRIAALLIILAALCRAAPFASAGAASSTPELRAPQGAHKAGGPGSVHDAISADAAFTAGKEEYQKGRYSKAIEYFQSIIDGGFTSPHVYYNLANAYFKAGRPGKAIVNYERALRINPRDTDARYNLSFVISTLKDKNRSRYAGLRATVFYCLTLNGLTVIVASTYTILMILAILYIRRKREWQLWTGAAALLALLISGAWLGLRINADCLVREAVVTASSSDVRNGPGDDESVGFTLHEGTEVRILQEEEGWVEVVYEGKARGWLRPETIERI
jgi:tetratricopeptide (TPR) repeat protein